MIAGCRAALRATLRAVPIDVISPNLAEARAAYGLTDPYALAAALLEDGALAVALRMGPEGSLIAGREDDRIRQIPAVPLTHIVDQTGAGNTYCGALLAGLAQGQSLENAARMGTVAASFCLEQRGVLDPGYISREERDDRFRQLAE
jgi:ribokinase